MNAAVSTGGNRLTLDTEAEVRDFLKLCLDPGTGRPKRTVAKLARVMPEWLRTRLDVHAPNLVELHAAVTRARAEVQRAESAYTQALGAWIDGEAS